MEYTNGQTEVSSKEAGRKIKYQDSVHIAGKMVGDMRDIGNKIICTDKESIIGQMGDLMKANM